MYEYYIYYVITWSVQWLTFVCSKKEIELVSIIWSGAMVGKSHVCFNGIYYYNILLM